MGPVGWQSDEGRKEDSLITVVLHDVESPRAKLRGLDVRTQPVATSRVFRDATHSRKLFLPSPDLLERIHRVLEHTGRERIALGLRTFDRRAWFVGDVSQSALLDGPDSAGIKLFEAESRVLHFSTSRLGLYPASFECKVKRMGTMCGSGGSG